MSTPSTVKNGYEIDDFKPKVFRRVIALYTDDHVGSRYGNAPDNWKGKEGNDLAATRNKGQKEIYDHWKFCLSVCRKWGVDTLIHFGDGINGTNRFELGMGQITTDIDEQTEALIHLYKPFKKMCGHRIYGVSGSGYHESVDTRVHLRFMEALGGKFLGKIANLKIKGTNRILNVCHGVSAAWIYQTMLMSREAQFIFNAAQMGKLEVVPDAIIRGHWHHFIHIHQERIHMIQLPGWQAYVPWKGALISYGKFQPDIGMCILFIDKSNRMILHHYTMRQIPHIGDSIWEG